MYFGVEDEKSKAIRKVKAIWTKIEDLKNIKRNALSVCDDRYLKIRIRTYGVQHGVQYKVYITFHGLKVPEGDIECKSFTVVSIDSLLLFDKKYYLQVYLRNCQIVNEQMKDYLDENAFKGQIL